MRQNSAADCAQLTWAMTTPPIHSIPTLSNLQGDGMRAGQLNEHLKAHPVFGSAPGELVM